MSILAGGSHPLVQMLGWTLIHFLWQGVAVGTAFAAARALLSHSNCRGRYALGVAALAALVTLPVATFLFLYTHAQVSSVDAMTASTVANPVVSVQANDGASADSVLAALMPWLVGGWCVGVAIMLVRAGRQWLRLARIARRYAESMPALDDVFARLRRRFGVAARVAVKVSSLIDTPMLIGWIKPVVLLPTAVAIGFPRAQLELVLAHELGHLRRFDHLVNLAQMILETLLFYHPVVHWISREVRDQRELCCDQLVVKVMSADTRRYARALASLEEMRFSSRLALAASGGELVERVRRLVDNPPAIGFERRVSSRLGPIAMVALMVVFGAAVLRRVDAPTLLLGRLALEWPEHASLKLSPLFAGLVLVPQRPRLVPAEMPQSLPRYVPTQIAPPMPSSKARQLTMNAAVAAPAVESGPHTAPQPALTVPTAPLAVTATNAPDATAPSVATITRSPQPAAVVDQPRHHPASVAARLVAIHTIPPQFPAWSRAENGRVDVSFNIGADGSVRNVEASGNTSSAFESAAKNALRQWRFDPTTVADPAERFTQSFVFESALRRHGSDDNCVRVTGSMICRTPADAEAFARTNAQPYR